MRKRRILSGMHSLCLSVLLANCSAPSAPPPPPTLVGIDLQPSTVVLAPGENTTFRAFGVMSDGSSSDYVGETCSASGATLPSFWDAVPDRYWLYIAGQVPGTYLVIAEAPSGTGGTFADTSTVIITSP